MRLRPGEAGVFLLDPAEPPPDARPLAARLRSVTAPVDDRILVFSFLRVRGSPAQIDVVVEFVPNRHNAVVTEGPDRTVRLLFRTVEGRRLLRQGHPYDPPPPPPPREGASAPVDADRWAEVHGAADGPGQRRRAFLSTFAWTSPINAGILAALPPEEGHRVWSALAGSARGERPPVPVVLLGEAGPQPYPLPLPGVEHVPAADLADAVLEASRRIDEAPAPVLLPAAVMEGLENRVEALRARCARLEEERDGLDDPGRVRALGDLLLARFHEVPRGADAVRLTDFDGEAVEVALDPTLAPDANARAYYDEAARIERARERLPSLVAEARRAWESAAALLERARKGEADLDEVTAALPRDAPSGGGDAAGPSLPYRRYRSSGGLEIRVGRGARSNDDLTFRHSAPGDVWLHARDVAGAHVILRWDRDGNPPSRDLAEAAVLAALGSKARTSGSVPVDWTRRKYVRKPRKAPPGLVVPERVATVFVEPDPAVERRLREE